MPPRSAHDARSIHLRALHAAAAVALGAACSSTAAQDVVKVANDTGSTDTSLAAADSSPTPDAAMTADSASDAPSGTDTPGSADTPSSGDTASAETAGGKPDCKALGLDMGACCTALTAWCDAAFPGDDQARNTCIFGPNFDSSTGCTPWGPPAPPAMALA